MSFRGKLNIYTCERCGHHIVTMDLEEGTTPFLTRCKKDSCKGMMQSSMYRVFDNRIRPSHVWYRPDVKEQERLSSDETWHVAQGGLLLRKIQNGDWTMPEREAPRS